MTLARVFLLFTLSTGCAGVSQNARLAQGGAASPRVASATLPQAEPTPPLRHFYLLSPGPNATLVVTRSDLTTH